MLVFIFGTTAEALKLSPIWRRLRKQNIEYLMWSSGQHVEELTEGLLAIGERAPDLTLVDGYKNRNMTSRFEALVWAPRVLLSAIKQIKKLKKSHGNSITVLVHGDTLTTLLGSLAAKITRVNSVHVEAGLRSGDWKNPFPEELVRRWVARIAKYHLAPTEKELLNLENEVGSGPNLALTHHNTAVDNLIDFDVTDAVRTRTSRYALVTIHRSEAIDDVKFMSEFKELIEGLSNKIGVVLVQDRRLKAALQRTGTRLDPKIEVIEKLPFPEFIQLVCHAEFVVTDSGGLQEEVAVLGVPTIVHRKATERFDGLGENVVLSHGKNDDVFNFADTYLDYRRPVQTIDPSPSDVCIKRLQEWKLT